MRTKLTVDTKKRVQSENLIYDDPRTEFAYFPTGSTLLDCSLGGGYIVGGLITISGWESTGKTGLAIEACANFAKTYPDSRLAYVDSECAFEVNYAEKLGLPVDRVEFLAAITLDEFADAFEQFAEEQPDNTPSLIVLDSLDALSTEKELEETMEKQNKTGMDRPKKINAILRKIGSKFKKKLITVIWIQQLREQIAKPGQRFTPPPEETGGKGVKFAALQRIQMTKTALLNKTIDKVERSYGVNMTFKIKKCKTAIPHREAGFPFIFGYGIDNTTSCVEFLREVEKLDKLPQTFIFNDKGKPLERDSDVVKRIESGEPDDVRSNRQVLADVTKQVWAHIEEQHKVTRVGKY